MPGRPERFFLSHKGMHSHSAAACNARLIYAMLTTSPLRWPLEHHVAADIDWLLDKGFLRIE